ncbi:seminal vesicle secretory protein 5-like [Acomys russatus]|uniref:seminal vesicle secretory protein 5-like n=1 Tax=Acomys russatus TaxID=60746 RepID=UPI0021E2B55A|nr:seminal vesicle secretory protein 5-like [Acomys russatus]
MSPTSFFLLTLLLVLVTEAAARRPFQKFSQASEDSSENFDVKIRGGSGGSSSTNEKYSRSESSWGTFKAKSPRNTMSEEVYEERKHRKNIGA